MLRERSKTLEYLSILQVTIRSQIGHDELQIHVQALSSACGYELLIPPIAVINGSNDKACTWIYILYIAHSYNKRTF